MSAGPEIGVLLPARELALAGEGDPTALVRIAELAEELGFDSVWTGDSPVARPRFEPLALLSAVAAVTERVTLGTAVLLAALRPPVLLAHALSSLDQLARGRLIVGVGAGFPLPATEAEFDAVGMPFKRRVGRLVETVEICRSLWSDGATSFDGRYWSFADVELSPRPRQAGGPPLWLAGAGERMLSRVGRLFDGWLPYSPTTDAYAAGVRSIEAAAADAGRAAGAVTAGQYVTINLSSDGEAELERYVERYYGAELEGMRQLQAFHAGSSADCAAWLSDYAASGARHFVLRFGTLDDPSEMMRRAAAEVLPVVRAEAAA